MITQDDIEIFRRDMENMQGGADMDAYQRIATKSAIYPGQGTPLGLIYVALKLNGEAGELAEHVGKAMRDDGLISPLFDDESTIRSVTRASGKVDVLSVANYPMTDARRAAIVKELGDVLWYVSAAANELGLSLSDVALANLTKLADRSERDALRGSGDDR